MGEKIKTKDGVTLVELIIAISIISVVFILGYKFINGSTILTKKQSIIFNEQQSINLLKRYLTTDLENTSNLEEVSNGGNSYGYKLITEIKEDGSNKIIEYIVTREDNYYSITRKKDGSSLDIISHQFFESNRDPFSIEISNSSGKTYSVNLYREYDKAYSFIVTSRLNKEDDN